MSRQERNDFKALAPGVDAALLSMGNAIHESGLDPTLLELVKLRASQINGCAFCIQFHTIEARKKGIQNDRLFLLAAWRDAPVFSVRERAALQWTEVLTSLDSRSEIDDKDYGAAKESFSDLELAHLTAAVSLINAWNRIARAYQFTPTLTDCRPVDTINRQADRNS